MIQSRDGPEVSGTEKALQPELIQELIQLLEKSREVGETLSKSTNQTLTGWKVEEELTKEEEQVYGYP